MDDPPKADAIILAKTISQLLEEKSESKSSLPLKKTGANDQSWSPSHRKLEKWDKRKRKLPPPKKADILSIIEKYKLKDKSLSKKLNTPYDRKLEKTAWPIELKKICRIKAKPNAKEAEKPDQKSLNKKKFSNPTLFDSSGGPRENSPSSDSE